MFTLAELEEDASLLLDLKDEVREECANLGEVTNVVLYDVRIRDFAGSLPFTECFAYLQQEPQGIMTVKFRDPISAQACIMVRVIVYFRPVLR